MGGGLGTVLEVAGEEVGHVLNGEVLRFPDHTVGRQGVEEPERGGISRV